MLHEPVFFESFVVVVVVVVVVCVWGAGRGVQFTACPSERGWSFTIRATSYRLCSKTKKSSVLCRCMDN